MIQVVNEFISTIIQIGLFTLIPFIFYKLRKEKSETFFKYIGLYKPPTKSLLYVAFVSLIFLFIGIGLTYIDEDFKQATLSPHSVTGKLRMLGLSGSTITILLMTALFKTSLAEEILFRGFIAKRLINSLGFKNGNILQALIFGLLHLLLFMFLTKATVFSLILILIFSSFAGWTIGYVKEKSANGSIVPGWLAHGLGNSISYFLIAFIL
jgi:membrane protease YdiL (CAAX protease family)